jgi:type IV pilus assembly protein PilW
MSATNLIQRARAIKSDSVLNFLSLAFKDFGYPVYLFGSYATGQFHGYSDVDILIIAPDAMSAKVYRQACNKMSDLAMNYDLLILPSIERLDSSITASLKVIHEPSRQYQTKAPSYHKQQGLTLIEIMIALLIGAFILGGVMEVFLNTRQTYKVQDAMSRLQENGRFAMEFMANDIRMADYRECQTSTPPTLDIALDPVNNIPLKGVEGVQHATSSAKDAPDAIGFKWSFRGCNALVAPLNADGCSSNINMECPQNRYYQIQNAKLYNNAVGELVEGVENMQILYGVDTDMIPVKPFGDGVANYYTEGTAANFPAATDWAKVVSVRVSLLLQTVEDNIASQPLSYTYNGATITATDRRIRRVFNSTFALRNRIH